MTYYKKLPYLCFKNLSVIKNRILIFFSIYLITGCVDVLPLPIDGESRKLFVVCEMKLNERIIADVSVTGDTRGNLPYSISNGDSLSLSLAEGDNDWGYEFSFDKQENNFYVDQSVFALKIGEKYKLRGIGRSVSNDKEPQLVIPDKVNIETFIIKNIKTVKDNTTGMFITTLDCLIKIERPKLYPVFLYIIPKTENQDIWKVTQFNKNIAAYKNLNHRPGFIIDQSRIENNEFHLELTVSENSPSNKLVLECNNVTESFYQYNKYISDISTSGNSNAINPAIGGGLNIQTSTAIGTFSALTQTTWSFDLK